MTPIIAKATAALTLALLLPTAAAATPAAGDSIKSLNDSLVLQLEKGQANTTEDCNAEQQFYDSDSVEIVIPEGMIQSLNSILGEWYATNCLYQSDCDYDSEVPQYPDSVYARRLSEMQTIIKMPYNPIVRSFIDRYATRHRSLVSYMLGAANYYMPIIEEALDYYGLPNELRYLPIIESALNPVAVSRAQAKGLWQFIFSTGKLYGLKQNSLIDERFDPVKSSYAAARYLNNLYNAFGNWDLAISAYNCGPRNVEKAIIHSGGKTDFWEIYPYLPRETRGYLPTFIAANYIMTYYSEHNICPMTPRLSLDTDTFMITRNLHFEQIAHTCAISTQELKSLNPQYIRSIVPGESQPCPLVLPGSVVTEFAALGDSVYNYERERYFSKGKGAELKRDMAGTKGGGGQRHKIRNGETLSTIARKYHVTVAQLKQWNGLKSNNIRAGKYLYIY